MAHGYILKALKILIYIRYVITLPSNKLKLPIFSIYAQMYLIYEIITASIHFQFITATATSALVPQNLNSRYIILLSRCLVTT